jgi:hypothetical protein
MVEVMNALGHSFRFADGVFATFYALTHYLGTDPDAPPEVRQLGLIHDCPARDGALCTVLGMSAEGWRVSRFECQLLATVLGQYEFADILYENNCGQFIEALRAFQLYCADSAGQGADGFRLVAASVPPRG